MLKAALAGVAALLVLAPTAAAEPTPPPPPPVMPGSGALFPDDSVIGPNDYLQDGPGVGVSGGLENPGQDVQP